jgi:hypothetical protein
MAQVTIYLPDDVARDVRARAKRAGKSLSAYIAALARGERQARSKGDQWPKEFWELYGSWEGDFPIPDDPAPADDVEPL